jgi:ABC-type glycerol-3-phosphate transport system substrate-binding protein
MTLFKRMIASTLIFVMLGAGCTNAVSSQAKKLSEKTAITVWAVVDDEDAYTDIFKSFHAMYPYAEISFKKFRLEEYEDKLLNALAEDRGPDVFMVHNSWISKYQPKIAPQPPVVKVAKQTTTGTVKKQVTLEVVNEKTESPVALRKDFVDAVAYDAIRSINVSTDTKVKDMQERVFGIPMSVDTLALYYNKDILNSTGISQPAQTWDVFQQQVQKMVITNDKDEVTRAGAGFGTGANIERASDVMALLMMQNRAQMSDESNNYPKFSSMPSALRDELEEPPADSAMRFYTDFANPARNVYTWNSTMPNSLEAFTQGLSAYFFGYSYQLPTIRSRAPKLNLGISQVPQISGNPVANYANYWLWTVSKKSKSVDLSWHLVNYMTSQDQAKLYLDAVKRPAARRALVDAQLEDADVGVFASQVLTAKSWYRGVDPAAMEAAFEEMADQIVRGELEVHKAVQRAIQKVEQTIRPASTE